jgi:hypothetical protein
VAVAYCDLGVLGGLPQNRRRDYCGRCQAVQEDTSLWVGWLRRQESGQGGVAPYSEPHPRRLSLIRLPRWAAVQRSGVEVEEGPT